MNRKNEATIEFRFYEIPKDECALALIGDKWKRLYGMDVKNLHFHNLLEIGYCFDGHGVVGFETDRLIYDSGTLTVIPSNYPHTTISKEIDYWEYLFVDVDSLIREIYPDDIVRQTENLAIINRRAVMLKGEEVPDLEWILCKILREFRDKKRGYREITKDLLKTFLMEMIRTCREDEAKEEVSTDRAIHGFEQIVPALRFIDENYSKNLKVSDLARVCGVSEVHLRRHFCDFVKLPPMDYVNLVRIQKSCEIMQKNNYSMDRIAEECGFSSVSTFNRNFRKFMNNTPYQWKIGKTNYKSRLLDQNILAIRGW
ncbi:MAG: AraC family transcriptional regulator [Lachnospiraceae bacterium]|nr:AraC family transcriptional regulator [Lachnospiraceae bacterium]